VRVELHPEADAEFAAQVEYYESRETGLGVRFYREVTAFLDWIAEHPLLPRLRKTYRRVNLKIFPFYIAYFVERDLAWALAVAHAGKRPGYWMRRQKT
jgi:ParE toxin of type II toxin-antitoxin system, parDE